MTECNTKLAVALTLLEECFIRMVDPRTGVDMIPHVLYNKGQVSYLLYSLSFAPWICLRQYLCYTSLSFLHHMDEQGVYCKCTLLIFCVK
jgi:hypothetical protein